MKFKILTLFAALFVFSLSNAQTLVKNDGATITIEAGATLFVQGGIENTVGGTITNAGTIEVQGDFLNAGSLDDSAGELIKFSGSGNSNLTSGGDMINNLEIAKTGGATVTLMDPLGVMSSLAFSADEGYLQAGVYNVALQAGATITGEDALHHVETAGAGHLVRHDLGVGTYKFPVAFEAGVYNPLDLVITSGTASVDVRAFGTPTDGDGETGTAFTENVIDETWDVSIVDGGPITADVILHWDATHELTGFDRTLAAASKNDGSGWDMLASELGNSPVDGTTGLFTQTKSGVTSFSAFTVGSGPEVANELALTLDLWLEGPYNGADMNTGLIDNQLASFPLTEPHTGYGYLQKAFGGGETTLEATLTTNNAVDWVLVELRDGADNSSILATKSGLLLDNGMVANPDGTVPLVVPGLGDGNYYVVVKHKGSLSAMTASTVDFSTGAAAVTFKSNTGVLGGGTAQADLGSGQFGLWEADVNGSGIIDATDRATMWNDRNQTGYLRTDSNLSGISDATDRANAWNNRNKSTSVPIGN